MSTWNDMRYSLRTLGREPGFAAAAILTVALGVGANTAIFSIVNGVLLRPLPYAAPERLVALREVVPAFAKMYPTLPVCVHHFVEWRTRTKSFESLSVMDPTTTTLSDGAQAEQLDAMRVSADIFRTLGVQAALGRTFVDGEDQEGRNGVAVITDSLWRRRFHADPHIVGQTIHLDSRAVTVAGILPAWFEFPSLQIMETAKPTTARPEVFLPVVFRKDELETLMGMFNYNVVARLKPGVSVERTRAELDVIAAQLVKESGDKLELRASVTPLLDYVTGRSRRGLLVLLGAVGSVLLIVCVNLANLLLARAERQGREAAIRTALGASPARLLRQAFTQALVIALLGGALGVVVASAGLGALVRSAPADIPRLAEVHLDLRVLLFALGITTLAGLLFGLAPAWHAARTDPQTALKGSGRTATSGSGGLRLRSALVAAEVGLSGVLLVTGALLMTSFMRVIRSEKGFRAPAVLSAQIQIPRVKYTDDAQSNQFYRRLLASLAAQPGVLSAGIGTQLPLQGETWIDSVSLPGDQRPGWQRPTTNVRFISPDYLRTMGIPLRSGRPFNDQDPISAVIVSESLARLLWQGQDPLGRKLMDGEKEHEVIGVAGDVRAEPHKAAVPTLYRPYWDWAPRRVMLVARAAGDPRAAIGAMRAAVRSVDSEVPLAEVRTMREVLEQSVAERRFQMLLAAAFAASALLLTSLGIYGVVSYSVARRTNEIGIRIALGAQAGDVYGMVLRQAMTPVVAGLVAGLAGAVAVGTLLASLLYEVRPNDPVTIAAVALLLAAVGLAASFTPARRALRADPLAALRQE
jgi:putative ABC transport system permease protein